MKHQDIRLTEGSELIGRKLKNCFDVEETAILPKFTWRYYDWCVDQCFDMDSWIVSADRARAPQLTFSENIQVALWADECKRFHRGELIPPWKEPEGCAEYIEDRIKNGKPV